MSQLKSERIVRYLKAMIDNNNILYIQMELCSNNLKNILENKHESFIREKNDQMCELEYYISCKIFIELVEALNYLHEQSPPIIHRDIKPANILFSDEGQRTGIFFKLCDFGLAKLHDDKSNTRGQGTGKYMAPEVWNGNYDTKADVYSLSIVAQQLFDLGYNLTRSDDLSKYFNMIVKLLEDMRKVNYTQRPNCMDIIEGQKKWCLSSIPSKNVSYNDNDKCQSLNIYVKYHLNPILLNSTSDDNESERSVKKIKTS